MAKWKPIKDAPKFGKTVIAYDPLFWAKDRNGRIDPNINYGIVGEAMHIGISDRWVLARHPDSEFKPTLWQPMPKGPKEAWTIHSMD